ncbi:MAG: YabP/YqfC family sporulation protein [Anaerocolumna sp.]
MDKKFKSNHKKFKEKSNKELYHTINKANKRGKAERATYLEIISDSLKLPSDVLIGAPIITAFGKNEICIENYKSILEYNDNYIKILSKIGSIVIEGKKLKISYFTNDEMKVTGLVHSINYLNSK